MKTEKNFQPEDTTSFLRLKVIVKFLGGVWQRTSPLMLFYMPLDPYIEFFNRDLLHFTKSEESESQSGLRSCDPKIQDPGFFHLPCTRGVPNRGSSFTATAGSIFFFLSLKLRHEIKPGRQHCRDLNGFSFSVKVWSPLAVHSLLHTELVP